MITIEKRSSGGRGEYEIAGSFGNLSPSKLPNLELYAHWGHFGFRRTNLRLQRTETQDKARLRRTHAAGGAHLQIQIPVGLLLPHPIREEAKLEGGPITIMQGNYLFNRIDLVNVVKRADRIEVQFGTIEVTNHTTTDSFEFGQRLERVGALHTKKDRLPDQLRALIIQHQTLLQSDKALTRRDERLVREIMREVEDVSTDYGTSYVPGTDPLPLLEKMVAPAAAEPPDILEGIAIESIPEDELELRRRIARRVQRLVAVRGPKSVKFRRDVTDAYKFRCLVCGMRYPKNKHCPVPGVDAAHIIAWREVDLDLINNGICLCKTHHWAFDQQLIGIHFDEQTGAYQIEVTERARKAFAKDDETLHSLVALERAIPRRWLPRRSEHWPHPQVLSRLQNALPPI